MKKVESTTSTSKRLVKETTSLAYKIFTYNPKCKYVSLVLVCKNNHNHGITIVRPKKTMRSKR